MSRRKRMLQDLDQEIREHIEIATRENIDRGMSPEQARYAALRKFGNVTIAKEDTREVWSLLWLEQLLQDVRFGLRVLAKSPGFTAVAILTLALGIGATTAIFSVVYGVLLRPLPYRNPEQIVRLWEQNESGGRMNFADANFADVRAQDHSLSGLAVYHNGIATVTGHGEPTRTAMASVSRDFFSVMGVQPVLGRDFAPEEQRPNAPTVALVSYAYWKQTLGSNPDLSPIRLKIDGQPTSVIGVLPPGFRFPDNSDIWISSELSEPLPSRSAHNDRLVGRLRDGISLPQARAELTSIAQKLKQQYGQDTAMVAVAIDPLREAMTSDVRPAFILLLSASGFLLLIACANVVNLMLAHAAGREKELSMRAALGAQRSRLIRQFLAESFLLSLLGGALGILLAYWGLNGLLALAPVDLPPLENVSLNPTVLLFSIGLVFAVSIAMGLFTALRSISRDAHASLNEGIRAGAGNLSKQRVGRLIAAGQLAMALVLLVGATLLGRSLLRVLSINSGFRTEGIVTMDLALPYDANMTSRVEFFNDLLAKLREIPGVTQVGGTSDLPLAGSGYSDGYYLPMNAGDISPHMQDLFQRSATGSVEKDPALFAELSSLFDQLFRDKSRLGDADFVVVSGGYFKTLDIPLLRGRLFD
ncbi:MAG: ABC transporter permease, partial [Candidatus Acidiferrum sp.]